jgi:MFS family permease
VPTEPGILINSPDTARLQANLINFLLYSAIMSSHMFIPLLSADLGASSFEVGLVGAAFGVAYLLSSLFFGWKSDLLGRLRFIRFGLAASSLAFLAQTLSFSLTALFVIRALVGFSLGISTAALIAYIYESSGNMGRFSSYGSLGWIGGALAAATLAGYNTLFIFSALLCLAAFLVSLSMQETVSAEPKNVPRPLAVARRNSSVLLAFFLRHLGATAIWIILPLFFTSLGASKTWIGLLWGINFTFQFIAMRLVEKFSEKTVFLAGQILSVVVFLGYTLINNYMQVIPLQVLLGVSWAFLYVGSLLVVLRSGEEKGTASGVFFSAINLSGAVGPLVGGLISQLFGYRSVMLFAAAITLAGLLPSLRQIVLPTLKDQSPL